MMYSVVDTIFVVAHFGFFSSDFRQIFLFCEGLSYEILFSWWSKHLNLREESSSVKFQKNLWVERMLLPLFLSWENIIKHENCYENASYKNKTIVFWIQNKTQIKAF